MLKNRINRVVQTYGLHSLLFLPLFPFFTLIWGPLRLFYSLWSVRSVFWLRGTDAISFSPRHGLNQFFYWTQDENFGQFGRYGTSSLVGLGQFPLYRWFHLTILSTKLYRALGWRLPLICMFIWLACHSLWLSNDGIEPIWVLLVTGLAMISTSFYAQAFVVQNYNVLGWMLLPTGIWALVSEQFLLAGFIWFLMSFFSVTSVVVAGFLCVVGGLLHFNISYFIIMFPASIKLATHFLPFIVMRQKAVNSNKQNTSVSAQPLIYSVILTLLRTIGLLSQNSKYQRKGNRYLDPTFLIISALYLQYILTQLFVFGSVDWYIGAGFSLFVINSCILRFADNQSMWITMFTLASASMIQHPDILLLCSYWILISPLSLVFGDTDRRSLLFPKGWRVYNHVTVLGKIYQFFKPVQKHQRIFAVFSDPNGDYSRIFDGFRILMEPAFFVATKKSIHLMPDWYAVTETNKKNSPEIFGNDLDKLTKNAQEYQANFIMTYDSDNAGLFSELKNAGYEEIAILDWHDLSEKLQPVSIWDCPDVPIWRLWKVPVQKVETP